MKGYRLYSRAACVERRSWEDVSRMKDVMRMIFFDGERVPF